MTPYIMMFECERKADRVAPRLESPLIITDSQHFTKRSFKPIMSLLTVKLLYQNYRSLHLNKLLQLYRITAKICCGNSYGTWEEDTESSTPLFHLWLSLLFHWVSDRKRICSGLWPCGIHLSLGFNASKGCNKLCFSMILSVKSPHVCWSSWHGWN